MYPELFRIGNFPVNTYGLWLAAGLVIALFIAARLAAADGLPKNRIYDLGLWTIIGGLLGSKILMLLTDDNVDFFSLDFLRSGGVYYGGLIGGFFSLVFLVRWYNLPFLKVADAFAPAVALGQFFGRQGCFAAGCDWGKPTALPWGVHFTEAGHENTGVPVHAADGSNLYLHPTQLYESITMLVVFGILFYLHRRKKFDGQILVTYLIVYALVRFTIEFFRDDPRGDFLGLTTMTGLSTSQLISLLTAIGSLFYLLFKQQASRKKPQ